MRDNPNITTAELHNILGVSETAVENNISFIQQVVTLLYTHKDMVESEGIKRSESKDLKKKMERVNKNYDYYNTNPMIKGTFDFLKLVVDSWFKSE